MGEYEGDGATEATDGIDVMDDPEETAGTEDGTEIRELESEAEWLAAYPVMAQLRPDVDEDAYLDYRREMRADGYRLFGLLSGGEVVAIAGVGVLTTTYYDRHLWVFDLVTDADHRSQGFGERLLDHVADWARTEEDCGKIALESALHREDAHRFYEERAGMDRASYVFTRDLD